MQQKQNPWESLSAILIKRSQPLLVAATLTTFWITDASKRSLCRQPSPTACCRKILIVGMFVTHQEIWFRLALLPTQNGLMDHRVLNAITVPLRWRFLAKPRQVKVPVMPWHLWSRSLKSYLLASDMTGQECLIRSAYPLNRPLCCTLFQSLLFFCVWLRSMKAGQFQLQ
ncbi:Uncharacterised protein [Citrobacter werkmanii]|nr:Uncharacterised protein [Citrobacter werkmanii]